MHISFKICTENTNKHMYTRLKGQSQKKSFQTETGLSTVACIKDGSNIILNFYVIPSIGTEFL